MNFCKNRSKKTKASAGAACARHRRVSAALLAARGGYRCARRSSLRRCALFCTTLGPRAARALHFFVFFLLRFQEQVEELEGGALCYCLWLFALFFIQCAATWQTCCQYDAEIFGMECALAPRPSALGSPSQFLPWQVFRHYLFFCRHAGKKASKKQKATAQ